MSAAQIGAYLAEQPLPGEHMDDDDLALLLYVATFHRQWGRVPRFREIAEARGTSRQQAKQSISRLRALGQLGRYYTRPVPYLVVVD